MSHFARATLRFGSWTMLSRLTGFIRNIILVALLGRSATADAFLLANNIPNIIYENLVGGVVTALLLPRVVQIQKQFGTESKETWSAISTLMTGVVGLLTVLSIVAYAFADWVAFLQTGMSGRERQADAELVAVFFTIFAWQIPFYGLSAVLMAILNSRDRFSLTGAAPVVNNLVVIGTLLLYGKGWIGTTGLAWGTTAGIMAMALIQLPAAWRLGLPALPRFSRPGLVFGGLGRLVRPIAFASMITLFAVSLRNNLLFVEPGATVTFGLSFQVLMAFYGVLAVPVATVMFPAMARAAAAADPAELLRLVRRAVGITLAVTVPVAVVLSVLAEPAIQILFERGRFQAADTWATVDFLSIYILVLVPHSLLVLLTRPFYALNNTLIPGLLQSGALLASVLVAAVLLPWLGVAAVAVGALGANSVACALGLALLLRRLRTDGAPMPTGWKRAVLALGGAGAVAWAGLSIFSPLLPESQVRLVRRIKAEELPACLIPGQDFAAVLPDGLMEPGRPSTHLRGWALRVARVPERTAPAGVEIAPDHTVGRAIVRLRARPIATGAIQSQAEGVLVASKVPVSGISFAVATYWSQATRLVPPLVKFAVGGALGMLLFVAVGLWLDAEGIRDLRGRLVRARPGAAEAPIRERA